MTARPQLLGTATTVKEAVATIDDRTTFICLGVHGQRVPLTDAFDTLNGSFTYPPFHWGCRTIVQFLVPGITSADPKKSNREIRRRFDIDEDKARRQIQREASATRPPVPIETSPVPPPDLEFTDEALEIAKKRLKTAKATDRRIFDDIVDSATEIKGRMKGLDFRIKKSESLARKITNRARESGGRLSPQQVVDSLTDINRFTVQFDPRSFSRRQLQYRTNLEGRGWSIVKDKNYWRPGPYRGHNTIWQSPGGDLVEIQFHTRQSLAIKERVHVIYDEWRKLSPTSPAAINMTNTMTELSSRVIPPKGAVDIGPAADLTSIRIREYLRRLGFG